MEIFALSKQFPKEEMYSLTDQVRRSSRSVCANLAEAWRKRRYEAAFCSKLNDVEAEIAETKTWLTYAYRCDYVPQDTCEKLRDEYEQLLMMTVGMINSSSK